VRYLTLCLVACALAACAQNVAMRDPRTEQTLPCPGGGVDPWSQNYACAAGLAMQGWSRVNEAPGSLPAPGLY
jgi:hypothetical protein